MTIDEGFELLSKDEWKIFLGVTYFDSLRINSNDILDDIEPIKRLSLMGIEDIILEHNNKVGHVKISYALCRHYYDKGIPDDPWYLSPGRNEESIEYFPLFEDNDHIALYWFSYFADSVYLKIFSVFDSLLEIVNIYYNYDFKSNLQLKNNLYKKLKTEHNNVFEILYKFEKDSKVKASRDLRNSASHHASNGSVKNTVLREKTKDVCGNISTTKITARVGDYTPAKTILENVEICANNLGLTIQNVIQELKSTN